MATLRSCVLTGPRAVCCVGGVGVSLSRVLEEYSAMQAGTPDQVVHVACFDISCDWYDLIYVFVI